MRIRTIAWWIVFIGGGFFGLSASTAEESTAGTVADDASVREWVKKLAADDFRDREAAAQALRAMGEPAVPVLRRIAEETEDPQIVEGCRIAIRGIGVDRVRKRMKECGLSGETDEAVLLEYIEPDPAQRLDFLKRLSDQIRPKGARLFHMNPQAGPNIHSGAPRDEALPTLPPEEVTFLLVDGFLMDTSFEFRNAIAPFLLVSLKPMIEAVEDGKLTLEPFRPQIKKFREADRKRVAELRAEHSRKMESADPEERQFLRRNRPVATGLTVLIRLELLGKNGQDDKKPD